MRQKFFIWSAHGSELKGAVMSQINLIGSATALTELEATGVAYRNFKSQEPGAGVTSVAVGELNMNRIATFVESLIGELALQFSNKLQYAISRDIIRVIRRNAKEPFSTSCHSHDFCDANEPMAEAFKKVFGREVNLQSEFDTWIWGMAWGVAKQKKFFVPDSEMPWCGPTPALEKELKRRGLFDRKDPWRGQDGWYAAYYSKKRTGKGSRKLPPKTVLVTVAACTGQWYIEVLESERTYRFNDECATHEIDEATD